MKLPFVPGPAEVRAAVDGVRDGVGEALDLLPRLARVLGRAEELVEGIGALLARVERVVDRAEEAMTGLDRTRQRADDAIGRAEATLERTDATVRAADGTRTRAEELVGRMQPLVGAYEGPLTAMAPSLRRLAETLEPDEVEAMVRLVDQLPSLVTHLDEVVLPVLASMDNVGEDVRDLRDTMQDLRQLVKGFPGSRLFRRRGAEEIAEDDEDEAAGA